MIVTKQNDSGVKFTLAQYSNLRDFSRQATSKKRARGCVSADWGGGTWDYFQRGMAGEVTDYVNAAKDKATQFGNVALEDYGIDYGYNVVHGALDFAAMEAGNPACMYGPTFRETDRSPIHIYIDTWTRGDVSAQTMTNRGAGILALVQALSIYRPVVVYITKLSRYSPRSADTIQIVPIPTQPMDLARATFAMCSPTTNRIGLLSSIHAVHSCDEYCASNPFSKAEWAKSHAPGWLADHFGVKDYLFMGRTSSSSFWNKDTDVIAWIKAQIERFVGKISA